MATFDSKTIVMMAENGHSVEIDGKKIQLTIVADAETSKKQPDYSHLVGKWLRYIGNNSANDDFIKDKWYKCIGDINKRGAFLDGHETPNGFFGYNFDNTLSFDLSSTLDHNPDDVRVFDVPSEIKISFYKNGFNLHFSDYQALWYDKENYCYGVLTDGDTYMRTNCIATECKFEDLQEGDLFFASDEKNPDFSRLRLYNFLNNDRRFVWTDGINVNIFNACDYTHYFKITPKP